MTFLKYQKYHFSCLASLNQYEVQVALSFNSKRGNALVEQIVDNILSVIGKEIRLAIPLGAGKPNKIVNAIYDRAKADPAISLTIFTALTLNKPSGGSFLEQRFMGPFADRVFGDYPNLNYETDRLKNSLPENIQVIEFYFPAGKQLNVVNSQCNYISSNYTHVARDLFDFDINVVAHLVSPDKSGENYSLSCNADVTSDLLELLNKAGKKYLFCAEENENLPYMYGDAVIPRQKFNYVLKSETHWPVFAPPKLSVSDKDHLIGLYASALIQDGGELQVGIGSLGDALVYSLLLRHTENEKYQKCLRAFNILERHKAVIEKKGGLQPFTEGLFGATEMFVDGFMHLMNGGILKRRVYDHAILQRLLNEALITEQVTPETLYLLIERRAVAAKLTLQDVEFLKLYGIFKSSIGFKDGYLICEDGSKIESDLNEDENFQLVLAKCLGEKLKNGAIVHGGFFLGCNEFYQWLLSLSEEKRALIQMKPVTKINQLYGHEELDRLHRKKARFVNTCLKMTLFGAAVSDGLEDGRVISGVGGQYNFVAMAHALPDGHSIIQLRSARLEKGKLKSNIVFNYGHVTIPRHLRDIVITEYGIADVRGKTDSDVAAALIEIADSEFQQEIIEQAKRAGKLKANYELPEYAKNNTAEALRAKMNDLKVEGLFPAFPFGTELTELEIKIGAALKSLKQKQNSKFEILKLIIKSFFINDKQQEFLPVIERMDFTKVTGFKEVLYKKLLLTEMKIKGSI